MKRSILICLCLLCTLGAAAQSIYKVVGKDGTVTYTDIPVVGATPVKLGKLNTTAALAQPQPIMQPKLKTTKPKYRVNLIAPTAEETIRNNLGELQVVASVEPDWKGLYQLVLDSEVVSTNASGTFNLTGIHRGEHSLQIHIVDNKGKILASSLMRTFYMHQASALINRTP